MTDHSHSDLMYRIRDIFLATVSMLVLSPVAILIVILLVLTQGKVFFVQQRPGLHGKPFTLYKFSTLYDVKPGQDETMNQKERLTLVGRYLRASSLDELPQLLNVLIGDMSLIGPRPLLMEYLPLYSKTQHQRHDVRPGITGWAQVNGRNTLTFTQRFEYDCWYVENRSHWLDLKIMAMTCWQIIRPKGVYVNEHTTSPKFDGKN